MVRENHSLIQQGIHLEVRCEVGTRQGRDGIGQ